MRAENAGLGVSELATCVTSSFVPSQRSGGPAGTPHRIKVEAGLAPGLVVIHLPYEDEPAVLGSGVQGESASDKVVEAASEEADAVDVLDTDARGARCATMTLMVS